MLWITLVLFIVGEAAAQVLFLGKCPDLKAITDFDLPRGMGRWFLAEEYVDTDHFGDKCVKADYVLTKNGTIEIKHTRISPITGKASISNWIANIISKSEAIYTATFPPSVVVETYYILATDYDNYYVKWSCKNYGPFSVRNSWIFTRKQNPADSVIQEAYKVVDKNKIDKTWFVKVDQKNCPKSY